MSTIALCEHKFPLAFGYAVNTAKDTHPCVYLANSYLTPKVQEKC